MVEQEGLKRYNHGLPWDNRDRSIKASQAQRQGLAQVKMQGKSLLVSSTHVLVASFVLSCKLSVMASTAPAKVNSYIDCRSALASASRISLVPKVALIWLLRKCFCLTRPLLPHEVEKLTFGDGVMV